MDTRNANATYVDPSVPIDGKSSFGFDFEDLELDMNLELGLHN